MNAEIDPIRRIVFDAQELMASHPPRWQTDGSRLVFEIACPPGAIHRGRIEVSQWGPVPVPAEEPPEPDEACVVTRGGYYDYFPEADLPGAVVWHVHFAGYPFWGYPYPTPDPDTIQVVEHPLAAGVAEALSTRATRIYVQPDRDTPRPVLIAGIERRCSISLDAIVRESHDDLDYRDMFRKLDHGTIRRLTTLIDPPTVTNFIVMASAHGDDTMSAYDQYSLRQIETVLRTAFTGFRAAVLESRRTYGSTSPVVVHSAFWDGEHFDGHRTWIGTLHALAAGLAGVTRLVFHVPPDLDPSPLDEGDWNYLGFEWADYVLARRILGDGPAA